MVTDIAAEQYKPLDLCFYLKRIGGWRSQGAVCGGWNGRSKQARYSSRVNILCDDSRPINCLVNI